MRKGGLEPPRYCYRQPLKLVRLPIPPLPRAATGSCVRVRRKTSRALRLSYRPAGAGAAAFLARLAGLRAFFAPEPATPTDLPTGATEDALPDGRRVLSVSQLTARVRGLLEDALFEVWVEGELSNCRVWNTGHMYFTLKDSGAQIRGVMFRSALRALRFRPEDGQHVVARGRISVYEPKGEYQIVCEHLEPAGLGALQLAFTQLKARLAQEGLFDQARKRALPTLPRKIGIVTSLDGAAVRSCLTLAMQAEGREVRTVESLASVDGKLSKLQQAFQNDGVLPDVECREVAAESLRLTSTGQFVEGVEFE